MIGQTDRPCWGEVGLPLLPPEWVFGLENNNLGIRPRGRGRPRLEQILDTHSLCSDVDWSRFDWPGIPIQTAVRVFSEHIAVDPEPDFVDVPLLPGRLRDPRSIATIPFLTETWEVLDSILPSDEDLAEFLGTSTALDLLQLADCPQVVLDVAITARSWVDVPAAAIGTSPSGLVVANPERPVDIDDAYRLAGLRHLRTACVPERFMDPTSKWAEALAGRAGIARSQMTLEEAGHLVGVTRERVRQLTTTLCVDHDSRRRWPLSIGLQSIKDTLVGSVGESLDTAERRLNTALAEPGSNLGLESRPLGFENAVALLGWFGHPVGLCVDDVWRVQPLDEALSLPESVTLAGIRMMVWELSEGTGFLREPDLVQAVRDLLPEFEEDDLRRVVDAAIGYDRLPLGYLFVVKSTDCAVFGVLRRMLSWANPLPLSELFEGLDRRFRFRGLPKVPPLEVIRELVRRTASFDIDGDFVSSATPQPVQQIALWERGREADDEQEADDETILGWIGRQLREADGHVLHRSAILEAGRLEGLNTTSVGVYIQFGEIVFPVGQGCYRLVGSSPSASEIDAARTSALRATVPTRIAYRYTDCGVRLSVRVGNALRDSGVLTVNVRTQRLFANRTIQVNSAEDTHGHLGRSNAALFGFSSVLNALDVMPGDQVVIDLDLTDNTAHVRMDDDADS